MATNIKKAEVMEDPLPDPEQAGLVATRLVASPKNDEKWDDVIQQIGCLRGEAIHLLRFLSQAD